MAQQTFRRRHAHALHIQRFAALSAQRHRLRSNRNAATFADWKMSRAKQRLAADAAIGGKNGGYKIVERAAERRTQSSSRPAQRTYSRATVVQSDAIAWRSAG
jgi:hypothetical protein